MQRKQNALTSFLGAGVCAAMVLGAAAVHAADPSGTWTWTGPAGRNGGPGPTYTLMLKASGTTLTGALTSPPRGRGGGGEPTTNAISNGKVDGDKISFDLVVNNQFTGADVTNSYQGTVNGDTITGTQPGRGRRGGRGPGGPGGPGGPPADTSGAPPAPPGPPPPQPWTATRSK